MIQPESTERCAVCGRADCATLGKGNPAHKKEHHENWARRRRLGYERVSRALAEAEKARDNFEHNMMLALDQRNEANDRLAEAEKEREAALSRAQEYSMHMHAANERTRAAEERAAQAERSVEELVADVQAVSQDYTDALNLLRDVRPTLDDINGLLGGEGDPEGEVVAQNAGLLRDRIDSYLADEETSVASPAEPAPEALDSNALDVGGGAQGEEK